MSIDTIIDTEKTVELTPEQVEELRRLAELLK